MPNKKLENRVALVTGGASGIGRAIAERFQRERAEVVVNDVSESRLHEMRGAYAQCALADVSDSRQVQTLFDQVARRFGRLDILVTCAGIAESPERWRELNLKAEARLHGAGEGEKDPIHWDVTMHMADEVWHRMIRVHLDGTFFCTREALRIMSRQGSGTIILISSTAGLSGLPDAPHYSAAKAGVLGFMKAVAGEVGSRNIRVNAICPGYVETPMTSPISAKVKEASCSHIPLGRWGKPEDIAETALFLASDDSATITGQYISPNGGMYTG